MTTANNIKIQKQQVGNGSGQVVYNTYSNRDTPQIFYQTQPNRYKGVHDGQNPFLSKSTVSEGTENMNYSGGKPKPQTNKSMLSMNKSQTQSQIINTSNTQNFNAKEPVSKNLQNQISQNITNNSININIYNNNVNFDDRNPKTDSNYEKNIVERISQQQKIDTTTSYSNFIPKAVPIPKSEKSPTDIYYIGSKSNYKSSNQFDARPNHSSYSCIQNPNQQIPERASYVTDTGTYSNKEFIRPSYRAGIPDDNNSMIRPSNRAGIPDDNNSMIRPSNRAGIPDDNYGLTRSSYRAGIPNDNIGITRPSTGIPNDNIGITRPRTGIPNDNIGITRSSYRPASVNTPMYQSKGGLIQNNLSANNSYDNGDQMGNLNGQIKRNNRSSATGNNVRSSATGNNVRSNATYQEERNSAPIRPQSITPQYDMRSRVIEPQRVQLHKIVEDKREFQQELGHSKNFFWLKK